jgi:uncharacterized OsmC-like protein
MSDKTISVDLTQQADYRFEIDFGGDMARLIGDEPAPLGQGAGPSPMQLLCAAVGNCLADSLLFALRKFKQAPEPLRCRVQARVGRNAQGRLRVLQMQADLHLGVEAAQLAHLDRVLDQFEDFCTVTRSVGQGIPIAVRVVDHAGVVLKGSVSGDRVGEIPEKNPS